jgi:(+)-trans-carveol dehydrogenase
MKSKTMSRLAGKVAFITGAAQGQGQCHAIMMAEEGADIIAVDVGPSNAPPTPGSSARLEETIAEVEKRGRRIVARVADVRNLAELQYAAEAGFREFGQIDCVIANAGVSAAGSVFDQSEEQWSRILDINLRGAWATCKAGSPYLKKGASIVLIGSTSSLRPAPGYAAYTASKHGLVGLMRTMMVELAPLGIRVNAVHPGVVDTPMFHNPTMYKILTGREDASREEVAAILAPMSPMRVPWVESRDVSNAVIFLCSDDARYVAGVNFTVDTGVSAT